MQGSVFLDEICNKYKSQGVKGWMKNFEKVESVWQVMWSRTLRWFYLIPLVIVVIVFAIKCGQTLCKIIQFCAYK